MTYLVKIKSFEDLKAKYREWALKLHPDMGGTDAEMQVLNNEYDQLFPVWKNRSEVHTKETKEKGGKSAEKAVKAMEKYVKQRCKKLANSALHGWFKVNIGIDSYYCVCDGMTAILLDAEKVDDLPFESAEGMNVAQFFPPAWESFEKIEIKEEELKAVHKNARNFTKTFSNRGSKGIIVKFGEMAIDTERMIDVVSALGSGTLFKNPNNKGACVYESNIGMGLILPLHPKKGEGVKQYSEYLDMIKANL